MGTDANTSNAPVDVDGVLLIAIGAGVGGVVLLLLAVAALVLWFVRRRRRTIVEDVQMRDVVPATASLGGEYHDIAEVQPLAAYARAPTVSQEARYEQPSSALT